MAHELETQNGVASFASFREPAWHGLGTVFTEEKTTAEMLAAANLNNWNVRLEDVNIPSHLSSDKSYQYVVRTNPTDNTQTDVLALLLFKRQLHLFVLYALTLSILLSIASVRKTA